MQVKKKVVNKIPCNKQLMIVSFIESGFNQGHCEDYISRKTYEFISAIESIEKIDLC
jgi:hypothetical protein